MNALDFSDDQPLTFVGLVPPPRFSVMPNQYVPFLWTVNRTFFFLFGKPYVPAEDETLMPQVAITGVCEPFPANWDGNEPALSVAAQGTLYGLWPDHKNGYQVLRLLHLVSDTKSPSWVWVETHAPPNLRLARRNPDSPYAVRHVINGADDQWFFRQDDHGRTYVRPFASETGAARYLDFE